ncbi:MAG: hypothetical protein U0228_32915 [Myxococcaceae bacterium]
MLRTQCLLWAAEPTNPWALAHGVKTLGPAFLASDGRKATDVIFHDFLLKNVLPDGGPGQGAPFGFQRYGADQTPIEPHTNLNTKALVADAKMPLNTKFKTTWGEVTLAQMVESVKLGFRHVPSVPEYWRDVGWTLSIFAATQKPGTTWKTSDGSTIVLDQVFDDALTELEAETADLKKGLEEHQPKVDKRKQGVYAHSCGGLHFVQGVLAWARFPEVRKRWGARLDTQVAIHFYRLESERVQYEAAFQQALGGMPQFKLPILVQMVKFYGHWLETVAHFRDDFGLKLTDEQKLSVNKAKAFLDVAVRGLETEKAFERMKELKASQLQIYLDLIGDSCHAAHGLEAFR